MKIWRVIFIACITSSALADVYRCTDAEGHHFYQSGTCPDEVQVIQMNPRTGNSLDLTAQEMQNAQQVEQKKQQLAQEKAQQEAASAAIVLRNQQARAEYALTQEMIKKNAAQFSAYAIPVYDPDALPNFVKPYESRLVEIETFRRRAAQKVLGAGQCQRVESDELSSKSAPGNLVFMINCSSGATFYLNEQELGE
jgi:hypothetical protein